MMHRSVTFLALAVLAIFGGCSRSEDDFARLIDDFPLTTPTDQVKIAYETLIDEGVDAVPHLVERITDETLANPYMFQREAVYIDDSGVERLAVPTIGTACEDTLRWMLDVPCSNKATEYYSAIQQETAVEWWEKHSSMTLSELRAACRQHMLKQLQSEIEAASDADKRRYFVEQFEYLRDCQRKHKE